MKEYDVIIIGAGAAGLTSAIYCARKKLEAVVISIDVGGQLNLTSHIENYPGTGPMAGTDLMMRFREEAEKFGAEFYMAKVVKIEKKAEQQFIISTADGETFQSKGLILTFGKVSRTLGVPGEDKFMGRGVSTCVTCDGPLFRNKVAAIVGGGNSAVEGALELAPIAKKIYLVHRRQQFTADETSLDRLKRQQNIELVLDSTVSEVMGDRFVNAVMMENVNTHEKKKVEVNGLFLEIGYMVDTGIVKDLVKLNEKNEIIIDDRCNTSCPGVFAAGDVTQTPFKQAVISAGEGAKAALECHKWMTGGKGTSIDWK